MDSIGKIAQTALAKVAKGTLPSQPNMPAVRPELINREADYAIPARVWSSWKPANGPRELRRELTDREQGLLVHRSQALAAGLRPFDADDADVARSALHGMFGGFRSLRQTDENAEMAVDVLLAVLREFPAWAIEEGCLRIATNQTDLNARWPPNDAQIHAVVDGVVKPYREMLAKLESVLSAPVEGEEPRSPPRATAAQPRLSPPLDPVEQDGRHHERVAADLAARRARAAQGSGA